MYRSKNRSKYSLKAHVIFVIKYRKKILSPEMVSAMKSCILKIAERSNFNIETMEAACSRQLHFPIFELSGMEEIPKMA